MGAAASLTLAGGNLDVNWADGLSATNLVGRCRLMDGTQHASESWTATTWDEAEGGVLTTRCGPLELQISIAVGAGQLRARVAAKAVQACEIRDLGFAIRPSIEGADPSYVLYNGYQSWDPAGVARLRGPKQEEVRRESWWTCAVASDDGRGIAAAAARAETWATRFEVRPGELLAYQCAPEGLNTKTVLWRADVGAEWEGEEILLAADSDFRRALGSLLTGSGGEREVPRGWLSWYHYGTWVTRQDVLENAGVLAESRLRSLNYRVVQVDDGWQEAYGDWRPNYKFAPDFKSMASRLTESGQVPGLWTAPFLVSASAPLAHQAPDDWFVSDATSGERAVDHRHAVFGPMHVLDARNPDVCAHLEQTFRRLYDDGFRYFKIDFLYAGAYAGVGALRAGVAAIREGVTQDSYVLACGAPLMPLVGLCDGCRIGQDTATPLYNFELGAPAATIFGSEIENVARNVAARHFFRTWFQLDADIALVGGNISIRQARQLVTVVALSGGPFFASDDLSLIPQDRLALLINPEVLAIAGGPTAVPDWEPSATDSPPTVWRRGTDLVAIFNWSDLENRIQVTVPGDWRVRDVWEQREIGKVSDCLPLDLEPSGVRLLKLDPA